MNGDNFKIPLNYKRDYSLILNNYDGFLNIGFTDGYADIVSDHDNLLEYLVLSKYSKSQIIDFLSAYLDGYEVGSYMSENAQYLYVEDGNFKEDEYKIEADSLFNFNFSKRIVERIR